MARRKTLASWTVEEMNSLETLYPNGSLEEIASAFPTRSNKSISMKAFHSGIKAIKNRGGCQTEHLPIETKRKLSQRLKGRVFSAEHKRRLSESESKHLQDPEYRRWRIERSRSGLFHKPNKQEQKLDALLQSAYPGEWEYVGDGKVIIEGYCPDFINCNGKKQIIELFGRRFHDPAVSFLDVPYHGTEEGRREIFARYGYSMLVIWDNELGDKEGTIAKIKTFSTIGGEVQH